MIRITDDIRYIGVDDKSLDLFEGQYVIPNGISYNSYVILDERIAVMDTVDESTADNYLSNLEKELDGRTPDYLIISHLEPDHSACIKKVFEKYPDIKLVSNTKAFNMLPLFFDMDLGDRKVVVAEGDKLNLGKHELSFYMAPMVHWPEVMVSYDSADKVLFSADGFGKFGALDTDEDWTCEARRYYFNIVGKYGAQVQALLKKAANLDISIICPLHGPILSENLSYYIDKYNTWSSYSVESEGVFIAYASLHGNTAIVAKKIAQFLRDKGVEKVAIADLARDDMAECIEDAFKYGKVILVASSYDGGVMPAMEDFLHHLKGKNYQNRKIALVENGIWAPSAARTMKAIIETMKNIDICENILTVKVKLTDDNIKTIESMAEELIK